MANKNARNNTNAPPATKGTIGTVKVNNTIKSKVGPKRGASGSKAGSSSSSVNTGRWGSR